MRYPYPANEYGLTNKEQQVLKTAFEAGYFTHGKSVANKPKTISITELAGKLNMPQPECSRYLANARRKVLEKVCQSIFQKATPDS